MKIHCEINLPRLTNRPFVAGSVIAGTIRYTLHEDTELRKITIAFRGSGHLAVQNVSKKDETDGVVEDKEEYVDDNIIVLDDDRGQVLPADCYNTRFRFQLPLNIPPTLDYVKSTYNHTIRCQISYYLRIEFVAREEKTVFKYEIKIISGVNPNVSREPRIYDKQRKLIQLLRDSFVTLKATISSPVASPGCKAELTYEIFNDTNVNFKSVESKLVEYTYLPGKQCDTTFSNEIVTDIKTSGVRSGESQTMDVAVPIPNDIYTVGHSKLIARDYYVKITVYLPLPYRNVSLKIPVQIADFVKDVTALEICERQGLSWEVVDEDDSEY